MPHLDRRGSSQAADGDGARWERHVEAARGEKERRRHGGSRAKNEDDGGGEEDKAICIWGTFGPG